MRILARCYPDATCSLAFTTPLELLVATILSAQCTDERVNMVTRELFRKYRSAGDYATASLSDLEQDIQSTGFFRNKAKSIQSCCQQLLEKHGGQVPRDLDALVTLPGIGRKTANVVLGTAYGIPSGVVVDTRGTAQPPARPDYPQGCRENRKGSDRADTQEGVDRLQPSHDPVGPAGLFGPAAQVRRVPHARDLPASGCSAILTSGRRGNDPVDRRLPAFSPACFLFRSRAENSMILSGQQIRAQLGTNIVIDPFDEARLNPNSYNLTLHNELMVYEEVELDMRKPNRVRRIEIPPDGLVVKPGQLFLGRTVERTETRNLVPMIEGRSSIGRLGLFVHVTAGFGDVGFRGYWTLEMFAVQPVRIYPGVPICQIIYHDIRGPFTEYNSDKYQDNTDIQPSMLFKELNPSCRHDPQMKLPFGMEQPGD